jgi:hypothetical protein
LSKRLLTLPQINLFIQRNCYFSKNDQLTPYIQNLMIWKFNKNHSILLVFWKPTNRRHNNTTPKWILTKPAIIHLHNFVLSHLPYGKHKIRWLLLIFRTHSWHSFYNRQPIRLQVDTISLVCTPHTKRHAESFYSVHFNWLSTKFQTINIGSLRIYEWLCVPKLSSISHWLSLSVHASANWRQNKINKNSKK